QHMDVKFIFQRISQKLLEDFKVSSEISHPGVKGDFREDALREFLESGKIPPKYGIGSGLIISHSNPSNHESNQSDLIIYDRDKCPIWMYSKQAQVFPIEGIYGIIEVKSRLAKSDLYDGLAKIENLRQMVPRGTASLPFGIIFAYQLSNNSLDSLQKNLRDYQKEKSPLVWPNLVVVLQEGIILQLGTRLKRILKAEDFEQSARPTAFSFKADTLFEFYSALFSILSNTHLGNIDVGNYRELPSKVGSHLVKNHVFAQKDNKTYALSETFINKVFLYCQKEGSKTIQEIFYILFGSIPPGCFTEDYLLSKCYYYDPENLPGIHQVNEPYKINEQGRPYFNQRMSSPSTYVEIDSETYMFPTVYVWDDEANNLTEVVGKDL
ncbi:MAG TPA: DUF6602 domain-containing protein, partial [Kamptonema sp.]|nr:DUF6602 domain-containing protein [Kamptonema sp.]